MSGIVAICHLDGAPVIVDELEPIARPLPHRGPDGILNSTGEAQHECQPLVSDGGRLVLVAYARVDNRAELIETVEMPCPRSSLVGDAALTLAAWRCCRRSPRHIFGPFAFVILEAESRTLFAARDSLGVNPLHHVRLGAVLCLASEAQQILRHSACPGRLDEEAVAGWLVGDLVPNSTPFAGDPSAARRPPADCLAGEQPRRPVLGRGPGQAHPLQPPVGLRGAPPRGSRRAGAAGHRRRRRVGSEMSAGIDSTNSVASALMILLLMAKGRGWQEVKRWYLGDGPALGVFGRA